MSQTTFPVEAGHVLLFARAIGDDTPVFEDQAVSLGADVPAIAAPPTFTMASAQFDPGYPLRPRAGVPWLGSGATSSGVAAEAGGDEAEPARATTLHAEQRFDFERPVLVGDRLTWTRRPGRTWTKQSRSGRTLDFEESVTEFRDASGQLVVTSTSVAVTPRDTTDGTS